MKKQIVLFLKAFMICFLFSGATAYSKKEKTLQKSDLVIEPGLLQIGPDQEREIRVRGGKPPYVFKTSAGLIRYQENVAVYVSPNQPGQATVTVKDAAGAIQVLKVEVTEDQNQPRP